ncbi:SDR family oxidoreductase [Pleomorphovibrio marinus]|uniref:SDR family oxidoreductase n=1 Tax=Pleomorphovibrio marinus TaxID=2164132 RepID=UPI000E0B250A|nr:SDR family oxidoreductase [Pleomorphovibrio marinus]
MEINLKGLNAVVGGSTRGLGLAIAKQLATCGANVTLLARNPEKLKIAKAELSQNGSQKHGVLEVDFHDFEGFKIKTTNYFKKQTVDILVNNTNGPGAGTVTEMEIPDYQKAFDLLFKSYHHLAHLFLDGMIKKGVGRIINVSSSSVKEPIPNLVLSNSIRMAVISWAKSLSREVGPHGITVNNILTGSFDTERIQEIMGAQAEKQGASLEELMQAKMEKIPAGRLGNPEEFGYLVAFLASPFAAYINGTNIPIDGGYLNSL